MSGFHLIPFRFQTQRTAWQDMQYYRAQRAQMMQDAQSSLDAANAAFHTAQQNLIGGDNHHCAAARARPGQGRAAGEIEKHSDSRSVAAKSPPQRALCFSPPSAALISATASLLAHSAGPAMLPISQPCGSTSSVVGMPKARPMALRSWNALALGSA